VPEFHQLNVKAWLMSRIQIALIARYDAASSGPNRRDPAQAKTDLRTKADFENNPHRVTVTKP
jgi:hypothetical protein